MLYVGLVSFEYDPSTNVGATDMRRQSELNTLNVTSNLRTSGVRKARHGVDHVGMGSGLNWHEFLHFNELMEDSVELSGCVHSTTLYPAAPGTLATATSV